jgi:cytochrome P450
MSSAAFVGRLLCRNQEWLDLCVDFSVNKFEAAMTLRTFPVFMYPLIAWLLPARKRIAQNLDLAERLITPFIANHPSSSKNGQLPTLIDWMIENGNEKENRPDNMAARQLILTLASIHTTATAVSHALFDLCMHPELSEALQTEIEASFLGETVGVLGQEYLSRLHLLDSFLVESQRHNPPILRESFTIGANAVAFTKSLQWLHNA